ncbi:hypothetical protein DVK44_15155 [Streptomyces paludis]|uniref:Uncharacterized protein n=1 Tax=Streptomyces paludis TaxID=2282738 RepID=A0A345HQ44_9ACTN|nr:hypothetical protein DVK44_15155 [Streptomyces paludis]
MTLTPALTSSLTPVPTSVNPTTSCCSPCGSTDRRRSCELPPETPFPSHIRWNWTSAVDVV